MGLIDTIQQYESDLIEETCEKCENYRNGWNGPYCVNHECEPMGPCLDWELSEFWYNKKGY